jgi:hypothetical protein
VSFIVDFKKRWKLVRNAQRWSLPVSLIDPIVVFERQVRLGTRLFGYCSRLVAFAPLVNAGAAVADGPGIPANPAVIGSAEYLYSCSQAALRDGSTRTFPICHW